MLAQGWSEATTLGIDLEFQSTLKGFVAKRTLSGLMRILKNIPGFSSRSNPGLELANAFGVSQTLNYRARAYCLFNVSRNREKYESNVTKPVVPWKNARPPVSWLTRLSELCP